MSAHSVNFFQSPALGSSLSGFRLLGAELVLRVRGSLSVLVLRLQRSEQMFVLSNGDELDLVPLDLTPQRVDQQQDVVAPLQLVVVGLLSLHQARVLIDKMNS